MPLAVYDNLIAAVHRHLPAVYRYYDLRRRKMKLQDIHHYDTYVPILSDLETRHTWDQAVKLVIEAAGAAGQRVLRRAGEGPERPLVRPLSRTRASRAAPSAAARFDGAPYILMNYQPDVLDHVFTLAHEAGHSMHSYYSAQHQPFQYYDYTIFVAEVASTFNEQLLSRHLMAAGQERPGAGLPDQPRDRRHPRHDHPADDVRRVREDHARAGRGGRAADGRARSRTIYRKLLDAYFGPDFALDDELSLECFRIPHFYRAFYVYKYATGLSAAIALSRARARTAASASWTTTSASSRAAARSTRSTCCATPASTWSSPEPVDTALAYFEKLVGELDELL